MKHNLNRHIIALFFGVFAVFKTKAQYFMMSSIASLAGISCTSNAIQFKSTTSCLDIQTGEVVFCGIRNTNEFEMNCEVILKLNTLGIKMYPIPAQNITKIKVDNTIPLHLNYYISVWNVDGELLMQQKESGYNLFNGITLDISTLHAGVYVLKIQSSEYVDVLKFVKGR